jgi:uncharacterized protein YjiS (DUF1127 family)
MLNKLSRRLVEWTRYRHEIARLRSMDDILLADMGIARECIPHTVRTGEK